MSDNSGAKFNRFFNRQTLVRDLPWDDFSGLVEAFRLRVLGWFIEPIAEWPKTGHEAFIVLDALNSSVREVSEQYPTYASALRIWCEVVSDRDLASRLDAALHNNPRLYTCRVGISGTGVLRTKVGDLDVLDPWVLRDRVVVWFNDVCDRLIELGLESVEGAGFRQSLLDDFGPDAQ